MLVRSIATLTAAIFWSFVVLPASAQQNRFSLALEAHSLDWAGSFAGEFPAGSGLSHRGGLEADDPLYGLFFGYRPSYRFGLRLGILNTDVALRASSECSPSPCGWTHGATRFLVGDVNWSVESEAGARWWVLEAPVYFHLHDSVELFAGPSLADLSLGGVSSPGLEGLSLRVDPETPIIGAHLGVNLLLGWKQAWSVGLIGRWLPTEVDVTVLQPVLSAFPKFLESTLDEDVVMVGLAVTRRF